MKRAATASWRIGRLGCWVLVCMWLFACAGTALAQVNIEKLRGDSERKLSSSAQLDLTTRSGNVDITELQVKLRSDWNSKPSKLLFLAHGDFGWQDGERFSNEGLVHVRYSHAAWGQWMPEAFGQLDYDKSRKLDRRALLGAGWRLEVKGSGALHVVGGTSYMLEHERYDLPSTAAHERESTAHRWSNYLSIRVEIDRNVSVATISYFQPRFDDFSDARILSESTLAVGLNKRLSLSTTFRLRYDHDPPDGIEDLDTRLSTGLSLEF